MEPTDEFQEYLSRIELPVTKEELINGLLAGDAPAHEIATVERLPRGVYESEEVLRGDMEEITRIHTEEVSQAQGYDDYLRLVVEHVGDVSHATKAAYNRVVQRLVVTAVRCAKLDADEARDLERRLAGEFARLRGSMDSVTDDSAPTDPHADLPRYRS